MLKDRLRSSAILISVVVFLVYMDLNHTYAGLEGVWLLPALLFFAVGTAWDITSLLKSGDRVVSRRGPMIAAGVVALSPCVPMLWTLTASTYPATCPIGTTGWIAIASVACIFGVLAAEMWAYDEGRSGAIDRTISGVFVAAYAGMPMAMLVLIRRLHITVDPTWGLWALLAMIATTKSADAGAYFAGKTLGKHKLIPRLSPGKTWEGAAGGMLTATIVAAGCLIFLIPPLTNSPPDWSASILSALLLGPVLMVAGLVGDLAESLIKRDAGAKDSGNWLPGLGGVWDVSDSLLAAAMPAFVLFASGIAG